MITASDLIECVRGMDDAAKRELVALLLRRRDTPDPLTAAMAGLQLVTGPGARCGFDFVSEQQEMLREQEFIAEQQALLREQEFIADMESVPVSVVAAPVHKYFDLFSKNTIHVLGRGGAAMSNTQHEHPGDKVDMTRHQRPHAYGPEEKKRILADYFVATGREAPPPSPGADTEAYYADLEAKAAGRKPAPGA